MIDATNYAKVLAGGKHAEDLVRHAQALLNKIEQVVDYKHPLSREMELLQDVLNKFQSDEQAMLQVLNAKS